MTKIQYDSLDRHVLEAVKILKSNIMFSAVDKPIQSLVITSSEAGAGKTTTSILLGIAMAEAGKKTLLVETDLRRPKLGNALGIRHEAGITNVLLGEKHITEVICATPYQNLFFIDSGQLPPNPVELIGSQQFKKFMEFAQQEYDVVIYDTVPVGLFIEAALAAAQADGTVLVIGQGQADYRMAQDAKEQLERAHAKILGVVLNKVQQKNGSGYYYDRKYYDYYEPKPKEHNKAQYKTGVRELT